MRPSVIYGWRDADKFYTSLRLRSERAPANQHDTSTDALREASRRGLPIVWDDPSVIDG